MHGALESMCYYVRLLTLEAAFLNSNMRTLYKNNQIFEAISLIPLNMRSLTNYHYNTKSEENLNEIARSNFRTTFTKTTFRNTL